MRAHCVVILHVTFEDMAQVLLACHHDVVQAFSADRADQALRIPVIRYVSGGASDVLLILVDRRMVRPSGTWGTGST